MVEMSRKLAVHLKSSAELEAYCQQEFGKSITAVVEYRNVNEIPDLETAPYIMFYNAGKTEGLTKKVHYQVDIAIGVPGSVSDSYLETEEGALVLKSYKNVSDIMQIIQSELNAYQNKKIPPEVFTAIFTGEADQAGLLWTGMVHCEWGFQQILGPVGMIDFLSTY